MWKGGHFLTTLLSFNLDAPKRATHSANGTLVSVRQEGLQPLVTSSCTDVMRRRRRGVAVSLSCHICVLGGGSHPSARLCRFPKVQQRLRAPRSFSAACRCPIAPRSCNECRRVDPQLRPRQLTRSVGHMCAQITALQQIALHYMPQRQYSIWRSIELRAPATANCGKGQRNVPRGRAHNVCAGCI